MASKCQCCGGVAGDLTGVIAASIKHLNLSKEEEKRRRSGETIIRSITLKVCVNCQPAFEKPLEEIPAFQKPVKPGSEIGNE